MTRPFTPDEARGSNENRMDSRSVLHTDTSLSAQLDTWRVAPSSPDLLDKITAQAATHAQIIPFNQRISGTMQRTFADWHAGAGYKVASLLLCAFLGFASGAGDPYQTATATAPAVATSLTTGASTGTTAPEGDTIATYDVETIFDDIYLDIEDDTL